MKLNAGPIQLFRLRRSLLLLLLVTAALCSVRAERRERRIEGWRPLAYDVALVFDDRLTELTSARADLSVLILREPLDTLDLDFGGLTVDSVSIEGQPARFEQSPGKLNISLPSSVRKNQRLSVSVKYHGPPQDGLILTNDKDGKPSATGDNWPDRVHNWIPCLDHPSAKATVRFTITAPARDLVVANGQLTAKRDNPDNTRTWVYNEGVPIPPYCMVIAVGEFALFESPQTRALTPLFYYVPQADRQYAEQGFAPGGPSVELFSRTVAPYPYEKLALIVGATRYGGMENSSAIVFPSTLFDARQEAQPVSPRFNIRRGLEEVIAHEIAHQWFGDSVTESTWSDLWLSEGFATYFAGLFVQRSDGEEAFRDYMSRARATYLNYERERRAPIFDPATEDLNKLLNPNNYQKGAWVLHMLRSMLGDEAFFRGIRDYYNSHKEATASTEDLRSALERAAHTSLKDFFARWVYGSGHPIYEADWSWQSKGRRGGTLIIRLRQTQADGPFPNPLPLEILLPGQQQTRATIKPTARLTVKRIPLAQRPLNLRFDPEETILKELVAKPSS